MQYFIYDFFINKFSYSFHEIKNVILHCFDENGLFICKCVFLQSHCIVYDRIIVIINIQLYNNSVLSGLDNATIVCTRGALLLARFYEILVIKRKQKPRALILSLTRSLSVSLSLLYKI